MLPTYKFQQYYYPVRLIYKAMSLMDFVKAHPLILVYQMAKVGSSTVVASIEKANLGVPVYHIHALTKKGLRNEEVSYFGPKLNITSKSLLPRTTHLFEGYYLRDLINWTNRPVKIITLVRDPIARNISAFFQGMDLRIPNFNQRFKNNEIDSEEVIKLFLDSISNNPQYHMTPLEWLDKEFRRSTNIGIYTYNFPKTKGYKIYHSGKTSVLLLKLEKLNQCFTEASSAFFEGKPISLESKNVSSKKRYNRLYSDFKKTVKLPDTYLQLMYDSKYARHFYSEEEITAFIERWRR